MKTLLVLAKQSGLAAAIRSVVDPEVFRVLAHEDVWEAEPLLTHGCVDACLLDAELTDVQPIRIIKQVRRLRPACPILIYAAARQWEWEEEAYLLGVTQILTKPVRGALLNAFLERLWKSQTGAAVSFMTPPAAPEAKSGETDSGPIKALEALRNFSVILSHSLCSEALLKQFLLLLREIIGVNRAAIFLRPPPGAFGQVAGSQEHRRLRSACALGVAPSLLENFELSLEDGIGRCVYRSGRILKNGSDEARGDMEIQKEFELLGAQVAIPILDRESLVGLAVFDGRLTGEFFGNEELALIFHLLEELGLAIKNSWLHDQLAVNHAMLTDVLTHLGSGCIVVGRNLSILHANPAARSYLSPSGRPDAPLEFSDFPQALGSKVFEVLKTGLALPGFKYEPLPDGGRVYQVGITPFKSQNLVVSNAVLLLIEDCTQQERSRQLEIETSNLRLVKSMSEHLAHEIGNSLVSLSTHQQLLSERYEDPEFRASLAVSLDESVHRIGRLASQMLFLTRDTVSRREEIPVKQLIEQAFEEARTYHTNMPAHLLYKNGGPPLTLSGERAGLKHALTEVILNALQASGPECPIQVQVVADTDRAGAKWVRIDVRDEGKGFSPEIARRAQEAFFSTRNVGLGLGLTVTTRIIETHHGKVEIDPSHEGEHGIVRISLPMDNSKELPKELPK